MNNAVMQQLFNEKKLAELLPPERSDDFFDALLGDAAEGSFDIKLSFKRYHPEDKTLHFILELHERPGKCLACNLTYGLPEVFSRHPLIDIKGLVAEIDKLLGTQATCRDWRLSDTHQVSEALHQIPLIITLAD
ncbi:MAG: pancreas/duodenum homeobox protein 1 [Desulfobulbaceae bacterium]|nr:MAG: pancreas/duodenum homeobox protein 1 [Desulfobulbaceae bacterium]